MLTDFKDSLSQFLKDNVIWICIVLVAIIAITIFLILFLNRKNLKKFEKEVANLEENVKNSVNFIELVGGKSNLIKAHKKGNKITIEVLDDTKIDKEKLLSSGVDSVTQKNGQIVLTSKNKADLIYNNLNQFSLM